MWKFAAALVIAVGIADQARAADQLTLAGPAAWVQPAAALPNTAPDDGAEVRVLLMDQQFHFGAEGVSAYRETAVRIQNPQGLQAMSTVTLAWDPALGGLTVHKVHIIRDGQVIDVLAKQSFTVIRRESNLEMAELDGVLTAVLQPEDLRVGDVLNLAYSETDKDPALAGHVQWSTGVPNVAIDELRLRAIGDQRPFRWRASEGFDGLKPGVATEGRTLTVAMKDVQPVLAPTGAPARFQRGRQLDLGDFKSWAEVSAVMAPLYAKAAAIPAASPLQAEIARIKAASTDPKARAVAALRLVEDQIRYVALAMNDGGLIPADADATWTRRFGDCKAKTVLLMALLKGLDIEAQPALVSTTGGDGLDERLPMVGAFDHVLVRATIGGRLYWLDGTRLGDRRLDDLRTPPFHWALPVQPSGAVLAPLVPEPLTRPGAVTTVKLDASAGLDAPAPAHVEVMVRGDEAIGLNASIADLPPVQRNDALRRYWSKHYPFITMKSAAATFDPATGEERLTLDGTAKMAWEPGSLCCRLYEPDGSRLGWEADFSRGPGPHADAPFAVQYPVYEQNQEIIILPRKGEGFTIQGEGVNRKIGPWAFEREMKIDKGVFTLTATQRSLAPEMPAADAEANAQALKDMAKVPAYVISPKAYRMTRQELDLYQAKALTTVNEYLARAAVLGDQGRLAAARADFEHAAAMDPKSAVALAGVARLAAASGDAPAADAALKKALALKPDDLDLLRSGAMVAAFAGDAAGALAYDSKILDKAPKDRDARLRRANLYLDLGEPDKALADIDLLLLAEPKSEQLHRMRAGILSAAKKPDQAMAEADADIVAAPEEAWPHILKGGMLELAGRWDEAQVQYDLALKAKPDAEAQLTRAAFRLSKDRAARLADLEAALKLAPDDANTQIDRALTEAEAGQFDKALAHINALIAADPDDPYRRRERGQIYAFAGKTDLAIADFDWVRAHLEDGAQDWNALCFEQAMRGVNLDKALADCARSLELFPRSAATLDSRAFTLLRLGRLDEALAVYDATLKLAPRQADSLYGRGIVKQRKGDAKGAAADIAAARALQPRIDATFADYGVTPSS